MPRTTIDLPQNVWKTLKEAEFKESIKEGRNVTAREIITKFIEIGLKSEGYKIEEEKTKK